MFLNNLAISWHLLGDSGDYLVVGKPSQKEGVLSYPSTSQVGFFFTLMISPGILS